MVNKLHCKRYHTRSGEKEECTLYYKIIKTVDCDENNDYSDRGEYPDVFSILVIKGGSNPESAFFYDVSRNAKTAGRLLELLHSGSVTPCTAEYIISDFLAENI